jgi:N5-(cytidine 5'-diphosphoramidyl)-L-glutamine hydrolase
MRVTQASSYHEPRDSISHDWLRRAEVWRMTPVLIPNILSDPKRYLSEARADLLVLTGGEDLGTGVDRDRTEEALLDFALDTGLPVLGVCRGMQLINSRLGGRLTAVAGHIAAPHRIRIEAGWSELHGASRVVNSFHATGIGADELAPDLQPIAYDDQGQIEAACHRRAPLIAVMWHPERGELHDADRDMIAKLVEQRVFWR